MSTRARLARVVFAFLALAGLGSLPAFAAPEAAPEAKRSRRPQSILYEVKDSLTPEQAAALAGVRERHRLESDRVLLNGRARRDRAPAARERTEEAVCADLRGTGAVRFAEPDYLVPHAATPNDPNYAAQWHLSKIHAPLAWDVTTGSSVRVAVCDTGVEATHPDLAANLQLPGYNVVDGTTNTDALDGHGTAVAGCIGAVGNNGVAVDGVLWRVRILPVRVSNQADGSAFLSDLYNSILWAADQGAKVVNMSYGVADSSAIDSAAQYLRGKGGLLFVAAGNDGIDPGFVDAPAYIVVGSTNVNDVKSIWSNSGAYVDVVAPGENITTTTTGGGVAAWSGTSFSTPIAAGVAALIYSVSSSFTPEQVESFLFTTCLDRGPAGRDPYYGWGRVDAGAAVAKALAALPKPNVPPTAVATAVPASGDLPLLVSFDGSASTDSDGTIAAYTWAFGDGATGAGAKTTHTYNAVGTYSAVLTVTDNSAATSTALVLITVTDTNFLNAPTNLAATVSSRTVKLTWTDKSANETGFKVERGVTAANGTTTWTEIASVGANVRTYSQKVAAGTYSYRVRAFNSATGRVSAYSNVVVVKVR